MSFSAWFNNLVTFRKQGGGFQVPELSSDGKIRVQTSDSTAVEVGATAPTIVDGTKLWLNTNAGQEGLFFRDQTRGKWLSTEKLTFHFGHDNSDGNNLRSTGILNPSTGTSYLIPRNATIVGISAIARAGNSTKAFDIDINGSSVSSLSLTAGELISNALDIDVLSGDELWVSASAVGSAANDLVITVYLRWRG